VASASPRGLPHPNAVAGHFGLYRDRKDSEADQETAPVRRHPVSIVGVAVDAK